MSLELHQLSVEQMERLKSRIVGRMAQERLPPISKVELFLTEDCNLRCDYCFVATKKYWRRMSWEVAQKSVDFLIEQSRDVPEVAITFFGGEPLLEFPLLRRTAEYVQQRASELGKQVRFAVTTNGTIMTEEMLSFARKHGFNYLFSIDGDKAAHDQHRLTTDGKGSWDLIMGEPFRLLKSWQKWAGARITVSPDTVDRLSAGVKRLFERGVNQFILSPNMDVQWTPQQMKALVSEMHKVAEFYISEKAKGAPIRIAEFEETLEKRRSKYCALWGCDAARTRVAVSTSGDLYPCARFVSPYPDMEGRYRLGTVDEGITNVAARMEFLDNSDRHRPKCASCRYRQLCAGGCPAVNLHTRGSIFLPCPIECLMERIMLDILSKVHAVERTASQVASRESCPDDLPVADGNGTLTGTRLKHFRAVGNLQAAGRQQGRGSLSNRA